MAHQRILTKSSRDGDIFPDIDYRTCKAVRAGNMVFVEGQTGLTMDKRASSERAIRRRKPTTQ